MSTVDLNAEQWMQLENTETIGEIMTVNNASLFFPALLWIDQYLGQIL